MPDKLTMRPGRVAAWIGAIIALLVSISVITQIVRLETGIRGGLVRSFDLNMEGNVPTLFSAFLLLAAAFCLFLIGRSALAYSRHWKILAAIFCFLAVDEAGQIHELTIAPIRRFLGAQGVFYFAWVIPAILLLILFAAAYFRFYFHLSNRYKLLFAVSFVVYVGGALGLEMLGARYFWTLGRKHDLTYMILVTVEETMEMVGVDIFIYTLLDYMKHHLPQTRIEVA